MATQCSDTILMIRPANFFFNEETAVNNHYQKNILSSSAEEITRQAQEEFDAFVDKLRNKGVKVITMDDTDIPATPDAVFPNNWISFHEDGRVGLYPMYAPNRRQERRWEVLQTIEIEHCLSISGIEDFTHYEAEGKYLEGTGSIVLDRPHKLAYAALSERTDAEVLEEFCKRLGYQPVAFHAYQTANDKRQLIYHTNVMMCIADEFAIICDESIDDVGEKQKVLTSLTSTGKDVISITEEQKSSFAGNMLQVMNTEGEKFTVMSAAAHASLSDEQKEKILQYGGIIESPLHTIETLGGGSARCMMAEVFLPSKRDLIS